MNHTQVKHLITRPLSRCVPWLTGLVLMTGLAAGCVAAPGDEEAERQADPTQVGSHVESTDESSDVVSTEKKPAQERDLDRAAADPASADEVDDTVAPVRAVVEGTEGTSRAPRDVEDLVSPDSTDTPQPSPWKGHNPPPIGPGNGPPTSGSTGSP